MTGRASTLSPESLDYFPGRRQPKSAPWPSGTLLLELRWRGIDP